MQSSTRMLLSISALVTCVKLLLIPAYRSTDFEVHRNWLAVTHSLPLSLWYVDETSPWTLDYPPLFAWMERLLACFAQLVDPEMLIVNNLQYASYATIVFQRLSVIVTDLVMVYAVWGWTQHYVGRSQQSGGKIKDISAPQIVLTVLSLANVGLLIVDSIHFQYNGFLFGVLLLSMLRISEGRHVEGAVWFTILLNLKHIYLYVAPAYGVYLLRAHCFDRHGRTLFSSFQLSRFITLGVVVVSVSLLSFGPFIYLGQVPQVISRLFPFKRGLCHAYWAPNFWALYNVADKLLTYVVTKTGLVSRDSLHTSASMTGGLVQEFEHTVLPSIQPVTAMILTSLSILPALYVMWTRPLQSRATSSFVRCIILCAYGAFMFGWHVHEKAILLVIVPMACLAVDDARDARLFTLLSVVAYHSLTPLLFTPAETVIKYGFLALQAYFVFYSLGRIHHDEVTFKSFRLPMLEKIETVYVIGLLLLEVYCGAVHSMIGFSISLPFLPLLLTSVYTSVGVTYVWLKFYYYLLTS